VKEDLVKQTPLVLVADNNSLARMITAALVRDLGFQAQEAADGTQALQAARQQHCTALLLDIHMQNPDGLRVAALLRSEGCSLPIIGCSAYPAPEQQPAALASGMDDYLAKPFGRQELGILLRRWIPHERVH
jgi:CheY-like chemotaxis protein